MRLPGCFLVARDLAHRRLREGSRCQMLIQQASWQTNKQTSIQAIRREFETCCKCIFFIIIYKLLDGTLWPSPTFFDYFFFYRPFLIEFYDYICFSVGSNGQVTYDGISQEGFSINPVSGVIMITKSLDRELQEYYTVTGTVIWLFHSLTKNAWSDT